MARHAARFLRFKVPPRAQFRVNQRHTAPISATQRHTAPAIWFFLAPQYHKFIQTMRDARDNHFDHCLESNQPQRNDHKLPATGALRTKLPITCKKGLFM